MKKPKFKFVKQEEACGCAIACVAMILGKTYSEVSAEFHTDFTKEGINTEKSANYLQENGVDVIKKTHYGYLNRETSNSRMLEPFADIHFISYRQFADLNNNHAVIMLKNGRIICPTKKYDTKEVNIYQVEVILGCYYDR